MPGNTTEIAFCPFGTGKGIGLFFKHGEGKRQEEGDTMRDLGSVID